MMIYDNNWNNHPEEEEVVVVGGGGGGAGTAATAAPIRTWNNTTTNHHDRIHYPHHPTTATTTSSNSDSSNNNNNNIHAPLLSMSSTSSSSIQDNHSHHQVAVQQQQQQQGHMASTNVTGGSSYHYYSRPSPTSVRSMVLQHQHQHPTYNTKNHHHTTTTTKSDSHNNINNDDDDDETIRNGICMVPITSTTNTANEMNSNTTLNMGNSNNNNNSNNRNYNYDSNHHHNHYYTTTTTTPMSYPEQQQHQQEYYYHFDTNNHYNNNNHNYTTMGSVQLACRRVVKGVTEYTKARTNKTCILWLILVVTIFIMMISTQSYKSFIPSSSSSSRHGSSSSSSSNVPTTHHDTEKEQRDIAIANEVRTYIQSIAPSGGIYNDQLQQENVILQIEQMAIQYIIDNVQYGILYWNPQDVISCFRIQQLYALVTLYYSTNWIETKYNNIDGTTTFSISTSKATIWKNVNNWLNIAKGECYWYRISCESIYDPIQQITYHNVIIGIDLLDNALRGILSADLSLLVYMKYFIVAQNNIYGTISPSYVSWKYIQDFDISYNQLIGTLPELYGIGWDLTTITTFQINHNQFTGTIPSSYFSKNWNSLTKLIINNNYITGSIPSIDMTSTTTTNPDGSISTNCNWGQHLIVLDVSNNRLSGNNILSNSFIHCTPNMALYNIHNNTNISGSIPNNIGILWDHMNEMILSYNHMTGTIPESIGLWFQAATESSSAAAAAMIDISNNQFVGTIPNRICNITSSSSLMNNFIYSNNTNIIPC